MGTIHSFFRLHGDNRGEDAATARRDREPRMSDNNLSICPSACHVARDTPDFRLIEERIELAPSGLERELDVSAGSRSTGERVVAGGAWADIDLHVHSDLAAVEPAWRAFEQQADCTVFQVFDWLAAWQRQIGARRGTTPAIVLGRDVGGELLFILQLAIETRGL